MIKVKNYNFGVEKVIRDGRSVKEFIPDDPTVWGQFKLDTEFFSEDLLNVITSLNLKIEWTEVFYSPPGWNNVIHTDAGVIKSMAKLNWIVGEPLSGIKWYESKENVKQEQRKSMLATSYLRFEPEDVTYLKTTPIRGWPSMLDAGILPHQSTNYGTMPRWAICMTIRRISQPGSLTFDDLAEILKPYEIPSY